MKKRLLLISVLLPFLLNAQTDTLILQPGPEGKDATVIINPDYTWKTPNFGNIASFYSWKNFAAQRYRSLIQFDLSQIPGEAVIKSAKLTLYADSSREHYTNYSLSNNALLRRISSNWEENKVNWKNIPSTDTTGEIDLPQSTSGYQNYTLNVTAHIKDMYQNPGNDFGFMLLPRDNLAFAGLFFASGDHSKAALRPRMEIIYENTFKKYLIPDVAFRTALKAVYPNCFQGDSLLIEKAAISPITYLNVNGKGIASLEGIQFFRQLKQLYCGTNNLTSLPPLPPKLTLLSAANNCFCPSFPIMPASLSAANWFVEPNKASCIVHLSLTENELIANTNQTVTTKVGKSLSFDGVDDYYTLPGLPTSTGPFTIEFWANPVVRPEQLNYSALIAITGQWNHFAIVKDSALAPVKIYLNGELKVTDNIGTSKTIQSLLIGNGSNHYKGNLSDLKIWNTARTRSELKSTMFSFSDYTHPSLVGAWKMNAHSGTVIKDYSNHSLNGTAQGCIWLNIDNTFKFLWSPVANLLPGYGRNTSFKIDAEGSFDYTVTAINKSGCQASHSIRVKVNNSSLRQEAETISEGSETNAVSLYPNPASGPTNLYISGLKEPVLISIRDLSGKTVRTLQAVSEKTEIIISSLTEGMYYVTFTHAGKLENRMLTVIK